MKNKKLVRYGVKPAGNAKKIHLLTYKWKNVSMVALKCTHFFKGDAL